MAVRTLRDAVLELGRKAAKGLVSDRTIALNPVAISVAITRRPDTTSVLRFANAREERTAVPEALGVLDVVTGRGHWEVREREDRALCPKDRAATLRFEALPHRG